MCQIGMLKMASSWRDWLQQSQMQPKRFVWCPAEVIEVIIGKSK